MKKLILLAAVWVVSIPVCMAQNLVEIKKGIEIIQAGQTTRMSSEVLQKIQEVSSQSTRVINDMTALQPLNISDEIEKNLQKAQEVEKSRPTLESSGTGVTEIPGVGTVRAFKVFDDINISYGLEVPTRRGHTDHFVPMNLTQIVQRWAVSNKGKDWQAAWEIIGGKMEYTNPQELALDIHRLYEGKGVPALDATGQEVLICTLPFDGIVYAPKGQTPQTLQTTDWVVVVSPKRERNRLVRFSASGLQFYKLKPDAIIEP